MWPSVAARCILMVDGVSDPAWPRVAAVCDSYNCGATHVFDLRASETWDCPDLARRVKRANVGICYE